MSLFTSTAFYYSEQIAGGVVPGPPAFYSTSFATDMMTPFFAINDGGWDSSAEKWKQWGSISGSLPDNVGASSSLASGSGAITYDDSYKSYVFNNKYIEWTGSAGNGAWIDGTTNNGDTNWGEQYFGLYWQGVIQPGAELVSNYIASAGNSSQNQYYGWDLIWQTGSVIYVGGTTNNTGIAYQHRMTSSFNPGDKYNVMFTFCNNNASFRVANMFYSKVNADGTCSPMSSSGVYDFGGGEALNYATYFYDSANGNTGARVGKGTLSAGSAGQINSASLHSFMMFSFTSVGTLGSFIAADGTAASASAGAVPYIEQIFQTASLQWVTS